MDDSGIRGASRADSLNRVGAPGKSPLSKTSNQAEHTTQSRRGSPTPQTSPDGETPRWLPQLPVALLKDTELKNAEWGWRREFGNTAMDRPLPAQEVEGEMSALAVTRGLWSMLAQLAEPDDSLISKWDIAQGQLSAEASSGILEFSKLKYLPGQWTDSLKRAVLRDRVVAAVRQGDEPIHGQGLFLVPNANEMSVQTQSPDGGVPKAPQPAVRWRGQRHSTLQSDGRMVHRIRLDVDVQGRPFELTILSCYPSLSIHMATDDVMLRRLCEEAVTLRGEIQQLGWQIERWTVSDRASKGDV